MSSMLFVGYVVTVAVLALTPGPSTMLGSAHGMRYGTRGTLPTIAGDLSANALQMLGAGLGLGAIIVQSETLFLAIKWAGVAYLAWMGIGHLRRASADLASAADGGEKTPRRRFLQGFVTSASNPKAVVFFAALFPQFIDPGSSLATQLVILGVAYLLVDGSSLLLYAASAGRLSAWLARKGRVRTQRRITGSVLLGAAVMLSVKGSPSTSA